MKNVLVVDDNPIVRRHLKGLLEREGCLVCEAADGRRAIDYLDARTFDVMFLDLHMPAMDGTEVLKTLSDRKKSVPVVLITSSDSSAEIVRAFKLGAKDYLTKPFREVLVRRALQKVTGLDFGTVQRTHTDSAILDADEDLAQGLRTVVTEGEIHHVDSTAAVPECVKRPHQLVFIGELEARDGVAKAETEAEREAAKEAEAEALADIVLQQDVGALLVRLLPEGRSLPDVTVFHAAVPRDPAALKRVWRAARSGGVMAAGRLVRALHFEGPKELEHVYWWTLRHSLETAFRALVSNGSNVTLDLSLSPENEAELTQLVDWALEYAEGHMVELALVREPPGEPGAPLLQPATRVQEVGQLSQLQAVARSDAPGGEAVATRSLGAPGAAPVVPPSPLPGLPPALAGSPSPPPVAGHLVDDEVTAQRAIIDIPGFEIKGLIGEGGMSRVYRATQLSLSRPVCIKVMRDEVATDAALAERFRDEGVALATLRHPNIVSVLDVGRSRDGQLFMVMEYVDGGDLRCQVGPGLRLPLRKAVELLGQLLSGLGEAHAHGIIHRDLKPSNVLVTKLKDGSPLVKLVDFGIAKMLEGMSRRPGQTRFGTVVGTPGYMAPEQLLGMEVTFATDLYAVGVILFELLTGRRPFVARDEFELAQVTMMSPAPRLEELLGTKPPDALEGLITSLLAKNPKDRPQTAPEARAALLAIPISVAA